jgi:hypothetical protein
MSSLNIDGKATSALAGLKVADANRKRSRQVRAAGFAIANFIRPKDAITNLLGKISFQYING